MAGTYAGSVSQVSPDYTAALKKNGNKSQMDLDMETFLQLIVAQIQNQDVMGMGGDSGSSSSGDYVNQLLQMSVVQALNDVTEMSLTSYAMGMVGKEVTVAAIDGNKVVTDQGTVTGVSIYGDEPILHVNGKEYKLSQVMEVGVKEVKKEEAVPEETPEEETPKDTEESESV